MKKSINSLKAKARHIRRASTIFIVIFGILAAFAGFACIGGGGVLNELYSALEEVQELERNNPLDSFPNDISNNAKVALKNFQSSAGIEEYIIDTSVSLDFMTNVFVISIILLAISIFLRIYFRKPS